jgi:gliding motility-associated-like protein
VYVYITGNSSATTGLTYLWTTPPGATVTGINSPTLFVKDAGEYSILVTNTLNGCYSKTEVDVINGKLVADFEPDQITGFAPLKVNFTNNSSSSDPITGKNNVRSAWNFGNGTSVTYTSAATASALYTQPGTYTVTLYATKGTCMESKQSVITVEIPSSMEIPNVFTPNGDGVNDLFFLKANNLTQINVQIFDRWGHIVYELISDKGNIAWDGKNQYGKDAAEGTYFYTIRSTGNDGQTYNSKGTVSLIR